MKCPKCKGGTGRVPRPDGTELFGLTELMTCDLCHGTGEVELTNEEWFCSLSTEEKARFFACEFTIACDDYAYSHNKKTWNEKYWLEWLKEVRDD